MELHHLSKIVATYPNTSVSRFATYKIRRVLLERGLANDKEIVGSLLICRKCSQKLIPGLNCDVSIKQSKGKYKNSAVYSCRLCKTNTKFCGIRKDLVKYDKPNKNFSSQAKIEKPKYSISPEVNYSTGLRTLSKEQKRKTLLESFFESTSTNSLYNFFH